MNTPSSPPTSEEDLGTPSGLVFNKYQVIRRLALGGMGEVFLARQTGVAVDRLVILKSLLPELASQEGFIDQFLDEARVAATLNHPNIVAIYEVGLWNGVYFIAMEYIHGTDLSKLLRTAAKMERSIPFQVSARMIHDAAIGLHHAHTAVGIDGKPLSIVHRDISPQNIMVRGDGVVKVVDFGIAKASNRSTRTATGMLKGKLQYMSPEQLQSLELDGRSDQFALGVVLWELATNQRLFRAENELKTLQRILNEPVPKPSSLFDGFPAQLEAVIMRMLARDKNERFASCGDAAADLKAYLDSCSKAGGELETAKVVEELIGDELASITENIGVTGENFMISLSGSHEANQSKTPTAQTSQISSVSKPSAQKGVLIGLAITMFFAFFLAGFFFMFSDKETNPSTVALPSAQQTTVPKMAIQRAMKQVDNRETSVFRISKPAGASVLVDGVMWPEKVPTELHSLTPGPHEIILRTNDGTELKESIIVEKRAEPPVLLVESEPAGAMIWLGDKLLGSTPARFDNLPPGMALNIEVRKKDYVSQTIAVTLAVGKEVKKALTLKRRPKKTKGRAGRAVQQSQAPQQTAPKVIEKEKVVYVKEKAAPAPANGFLTLKTTPWAKVFIDGAPAGSTPLFKYKLSPGKHTILLVNEGAGIRVTKSVTVQPGKNIKKNWTLK